MIKAVFLDSHNTIEDSSQISSCRAKMFEEIATYISGHAVPCAVRDIRNHLDSFKNKFPSVLWENYPFFWRSLLLKLGVRLPDNRIIVSVYSSYLDQYLRHIQVYPDVLPFLRRCCASNIDLFLVANGHDSRLRAFINKFDLQSFLKDVLISGETFFRKPDAFMFEYLLATYSFNPENVLMIGDRSDNDILGAKQLGINTLLIKRGIATARSEGPWCLPDFSCNNLDEAYNLIKGINCKTFFPYLGNTTNTEKQNKIRSAFVLAGGKGTRLGKLAPTQQKAMLPVFGKPILEHVVGSLQDAGVEKIIIAVNHKSEQVIDYFQDGRRYGITISYVLDTFASTAEALSRSLDLLDDSFFYCHGNVFFQERLLELIWQMNASSESSVIALVPKATSIKHLKVRSMSGNNIIDATTFPDPCAPLTFLGVSLYKKGDIRAYLDKGDMTEAFIPRMLGDGGHIEGLIYQGIWHHLETENDYLTVTDVPLWRFHLDRIS